MWLASKLSFTFCLFDVFSTKRALEMFWSASPVFGCCFIPDINVCDFYILAAVLSVSERCFSLDCLMVLLLGTWNCWLTSALFSFVSLSWVTWPSHVIVSGSRFSRQSGLKVEMDTCMFQGILLLESSMLCTFAGNL